MRLSLPNGAGSHEGIDPSPESDRPERFYVLHVLAPTFVTRTGISRVNDFERILTGCSLFPLCLDGMSHDLD